MKQNLLALFVLLLCAGNISADDILTVNAYTDVVGDGYVDIELSNPDNEYMGFQILLQLPEDVTCMEDEEDEGFYVVEYGDRFNSVTSKNLAYYNLQMAKITNGYQIVCLNQRGKAVPGTEGQLIRVPIKDKTASAMRRFSVTFANIEFTTLDAKAKRPDDVSLIANTESVSTSVTVGIRELESVNIEQDGSIFNLNGQKISSPKEGVYIKSGKKVIIK